MATAKTAGAERAVYVVISPLVHGELVDKKVVEDRYEPGSEIELTADQAKPLLGHTVRLKDAAKAG